MMQGRWKKVTVTHECMRAFFRPGAWPQADVVAGLPADAMLIDVFFDTVESLIVFVYESAEFDWVKIIFKNSAETLRDRHREIPELRIEFEQQYVRIEDVPWHRHKPLVVNHEKSRTHTQPEPEVPAPTKRPRPRHVVYGTGLSTWPMPTGEGL